MTPLSSSIDEAIRVKREDVAAPIFFSEYSLPGGVGSRRTPRGTIGLADPIAAGAFLSAVCEN